MLGLLFQNPYSPYRNVKVQNQPITKIGFDN